MACANFKMRKQTNSSTTMTVCAMVGLLAGASMIFYYEINHQPAQLVIIAGLYIALTLTAWLYAKIGSKGIGVT